MRPSFSPRGLFSHAASVALAAFAIAGCATEASEPADLPEADETGLDPSLVHGTSATDRPAVGKLVLSTMECSGTLISPNVVLTAAHCFGYGSSSSTGNYGSFRVYSTQSSYTSYTVSEYTSLGTTPGTWDQAVVHLSSVVPSTRATPIPVATSYPTSGTPMSLYGFGTTSRSSTSSNYAKRRYDYSYGTVTSEACQGDSGGPAVNRNTSNVVALISGYSASTGQDALADVVAWSGTINAWVNYWQPPVADCGAWTPYTQWTCSSDGVTRGRCTATGVEFQRCTTSCVQTSNGAVCQ